ncbi:MAG: hypothetical protein H7287_06885 [Thermoleophilia bacterium]|nr:hypothetical protein [Thermoleophilia bacterium]
MGTIIAVTLFIAVVAAAYQSRQREAGSWESHDQPRRAPRPGARDSYAVTGMLGRAPVPSWG